MDTKIEQAALDAEKKAQEQAVVEQTKKVKTKQNEHQAEERRKLFAIVRNQVD